MGEIRVKVKLTNAVDDELFRTGRLPKERLVAVELQSHSEKIAAPTSNLIATTDANDC